MPRPKTYNGLTERQIKFLQDFLAARYLWKRYYVRRNNNLGKWNLAQPTIAELARKWGISRNGMHSHVHSLRLKGYLAQTERHKKRGYYVTRRGQEALALALEEMENSNGVRSEDEG
jgi:predicted transcriptional regulator